MFSRKTRPIAATSDPLAAAASKRDVVGAINQLSVDTSKSSRERSVSKQHEILREIPAAPSPPERPTQSFPSTGLSRIRKPSAATTVSKSETSQPSTPQPGTPQSVAKSLEAERSSSRPSTPVGEGWLAADALGRRVWRHFASAESQADLRDMIADSNTGVVVLPQSNSERSDLDAVLNDNVLFTEDGTGKFMTASGICGRMDGKAVSALGVLPPMEDIVLVMSDTDAPRTTMFDVLDADLMSGPPLQRLHVEASREMRLPDGRVVRAIVTSGVLDRGLVVDSAVTTLSARTFGAMDAAFGSLVPRASESVTSDDGVRVDVEEIMRFAHTVEMRQPREKPASLAWIGGRRTGPDVEADAVAWQQSVGQLEERVAGFVDRLEAETSECGDAEARRQVTAGVVEGVEKLVMEAVYLRVFSPAFSDDRARDEQFASRVAALNVAGFGPEHLELPPTDPSVQRACAEAGRLLVRVNAARSPAEKLRFIVDAHKCVVDRVSLPNARSADVILPLLILAVVRSNPPRFISNLRYMRRFRARALLEPHFEYCLTNIQAVASFVVSVDARSLGRDKGAVNSGATPLSVLHSVNSAAIDVVQGVAGGGRKVAANVFDATLGRLIDSSTLLMSRAPWKSPTASERELQSTPASTDDATDSISEKPSSYEIKGHLLPRRSATRSSEPAASTEQLPLAPAVVERFLAVDASDLRIGDIAQLLESYKELARYHISH
ncbi:hypothetical protein GGF46_005519 [Coemansia sp. RSA 552]|nr:hypothetical protein GGF46_005519 [Coemansia sp. RSA 552]